MVASLHTEIDWQARAEYAEAILAGLVPILSNKQMKASKKITLLGELTLTLDDEQEQYAGYPSRGHTCATLAERTGQSTSTTRKNAESLAIDGDLTVDPGVGEGAPFVHHGVQRHGDLPRYHLAESPLDTLTHAPLRQRAPSGHGGLRVPWPKDPDCLILERHTTSRFVRPDTGETVYSPQPHIVTFRRIENHLDSPSPTPIRQRSRWFSIEPKPSPVVSREIERPLRR